MSREVHVRICEGVGVRFPHATRQDNPIAWMWGVFAYLGGSKGKNRRPQDPIFPPISFFQTSAAFGAETRTFAVRIT